MSNQTQVETIVKFVPVEPLVQRIWSELHGDRQAVINRLLTRHRWEEGEAVAEIDRLVLALKEPRREAKHPGASHG